MRLLTVNRTLPENDNEVKTEKAMRESSFSLSRHVCKVPSSCPCVTLQTIAHQAPLSMGFSRQEYWSGLPFLLQWIRPRSLALQTDYLPSEPPGMMSHYMHTYLQTSTEKDESIHPQISKSNASTLFSQTSPKPDIGHLVNTHCLNKWFS